MVFNQPTFPLLYTIDGSTRHEVLQVSAKTPFADLSNQISKASATSPNCTELLSKYKTVGEEGEKIGQIKVRWSSVGRDQKVWPQSTALTEANCEAVLNLMDTSKDVLEVRSA